MKIIIIFDLV